MEQPEDGAVQRRVRISAGRDVPYPEPTTAAATLIGKSNGRRDTRPDLALRSELHARGYRFRVDYLVRADDAKTHVDVCFTRLRIAVFVDGCFWHSCPIHQHLPKSNRGYWIPKLAANVERDRRVDAALHRAGWIVLRPWEHQAADEAADAVAWVVEWQRVRLSR